MGIDIHGWVEVSQLDTEERGEDYAWSGIINVPVIIDGCDEVSQLLFGFSKHALTGGHLPHQPIARNRGLPPNPSGSVKQDLDEIREYERNHGSGEIGGYTHIDFAEIESLDWQQHGIRDLESSDWWTLFKMIRVLRSDHRFGTAGIRIVCWFCW